MVNSLLTKGGLVTAESCMERFLAAFLERDMLLGGFPRGNFIFNYRRLYFIQRK